MNFEKWMSIREYDNVYCADDDTAAAAALVAIDDHVDVLLTMIHRQVWLSMMSINRSHIRKQNEIVRVRLLEKKDDIFIPSKETGEWILN